MVVVSIKKDGDVVSSINISGHACFADHGNDIVCAGISSIIFGGLNALVELGLDQDNIKVDSDIYIDLTNASNSIDIVVQTIIIQLKTIRESYPDYLDINY